MIDDLQYMKMYGIEQWAEEQERTRVVPNLEKDSTDIPVSAPNITRGFAETPLSDPILPHRRFVPSQMGSCVMLLAIPLQSKLKRSLS